MTKRILLTRNKVQNKSLGRVVENLGFETFEAPLIEIVKSSDISALRTIREDVERFDMFIFVSVHAVQSGIQILLEQKKRIKSDALFIAVGERTAAELSDHVSSVLFPDSGVGGEALMEAEEMSDLEDKQVMIVRGENGKPWLGNEVENRGGDVEYFDCYRRRQPRFLETSLNQLFSKQMFDVCFLHSAHAAANLVKAAGSLRKEVMSADVVVGSADIQKLLLEFGWRGKIAVASTPSNDDMLSALTSIYD